jgi:hypothetical protein
MTNTVTKFKAFIGSRDVIERIEELEELDARTEDEIKELASLLQLREECEQHAPDWHHGSTLIQYSAFVDHITEIIQDAYAPTSDFDFSIWPWRHLNYDAAAEEAKGDYTEVDFDGVGYLIR